MSRDGAPLSRYGDELVERSVVVGAPPTAIDYSPSGRAQVNGYVDRVDRAADRLNNAFVTWLREKWTDVAPDAQKPPTDDERSFIVDFQPWFARWKAARERFLTPEWAFPPPPSAIWMETEQFETELEAFRQRFAKLLSADPGLHVQAPPAPPKQSDGTPGYEDPGGVKQPGLLEGLGVTGALDSVATIVIAAAVAVVGIVLVKR